MQIFHTLYGIYALLVFGIVVFGITCPLVIIGPTLPIRRFVGRYGVRTAMWLIGSPLRIRGREHIPDEPCVVVANHASYLDGIVLTAALPPHVSFLVQDGAASWPYVGVVIRRMGVSFVARGRAREASRQMRALIRRAQAGESLAIFPEGTFEAGPGLLRFRDGAFMIAVHGNLPVVPTVIRGTRTVLGDGQWLPRAAAVTIAFLPAMHPEGHGRPAVIALRERARARILEQLGEPDREHTAAATA